MAFLEQQIVFHGRRGMMSSSNARSDTPVCSVGRNARHSGQRSRCRESVRMLRSAGLTTVRALRQ